MKEYQLSIKKQMDQLGLTPYRVAKDIKIYESKARALKAGTVKRVSIEDISALCDYFSCTPNDIIIEVSDHE